MVWDNIVKSDSYVNHHSESVSAIDIGQWWADRTKEVQESTGHSICSKLLIAALLQMEALRGQSVVLVIGLCPIHDSTIDLSIPYSKDIGKTIQWFRAVEWISQKKALVLNFYEVKGGWSCREQLEFQEEIHWS